MRRAPLLVLPLMVALTGCLSSGLFAPAEDPGPPNGDKDRTLEYWGKLRGVMSRRAQTDDLRGLANMVLKQAEAIRALPCDGVDPELVAAAEAVAKCQDRVVEMAEIADFEMAGIRAAPAVAREFVQANQQAGLAAARLKALHKRLGARYRVEFVAMER